MSEQSEHRADRLMAELETRWGAEANAYELACIAEAEEDKEE
jgi:hypothetical protein